MKKKYKSPITLSEKNKKRQAELKAAEIAQERNKNKVSIRINNNTQLFIDKKELKEKGEEYFIEIFNRESKVKIHGGKKI